MSGISPQDRLEAPVEPSEYLTVEEAAKVARCHPKTIRRAVHDGRLRVFRPAKRMLFLQADVHAWVQSAAAVEPQSPSPRRSRTRRHVPGSVASLKALEREAAR